MKPLIAALIILFTVLFFSCKSEKEEMNYDEVIISVYNINYLFAENEDELQEELGKYALPYRYSYHNGYILYCPQRTIKINKDGNYNLFIQKRYYDHGYLFYSLADKIGTYKGSLKIDSLNYFLKQIEMHPPDTVYVRDSTEHCTRGSEKRFFISLRSGANVRYYHLHSETAQHEIGESAANLFKYLNNHVTESSISTSSDTSGISEIYNYIYKTALAINLKTPGLLRKPIKFTVKFIPPKE